MKYSFIILLCVFASTEAPVAYARDVDEIVGRESGIGSDRDRSSNDWLSLFGYQGGNIRALGTSSQAGSGVVSGCRTASSGANCIGLTTWAFNDQSSPGFTNWALYGENRLFEGSSSGIGAEFNITSWNSNGAIDSYGRSSPNGVLAVALQLGSGGTCGLSPHENAERYLCYNPRSGLKDLATSNPTSSAIQIVGNGSSFYSGITFTYNSILGTDGSSGLGAAIQMASGHALVWQFCDNTKHYPKNCSPRNYGTQLYSTVSDSAKRTNIISSNDGFTISNAKESWALNVPVDETYISGLQLLGSSAGPVDIRAVGAPEDIDLKLSPKGSGVLDFTVGELAVGSCVPKQLLTVKINGELRRIPVC